MAAVEAQEPPLASFECNAHNTALCLIPPENTWTAVEHLRALYDKSYRKWPPHVNLLYPFVHPESLDGAVQQLQTVLANGHSKAAAGVDIRLDTSGVFRQRREHTLFLHDGREDGSLEHLRQLRASLLEALGHGKDGQEDLGKPYHMHMTVAQSDVASGSASVDASSPSDTQGHSHRFLLHKVELLPPVEWHADRLHILVREQITAQAGRTGEATGATSRMRLWGVLHLEDGRLEKLEHREPFYSHLPLADNKNRHCGLYQDTDNAKDNDSDDDNDEVESHSSLVYVSASDRWERPAARPTSALSLPPSSLSIASYNVLAEFEWPPSQRRVPLLIRNILSAQSDILVLQEVTDHFLGAMLAHKGVQAAYPHVSHGPPDQPDLEPLPSLLNVVVLSRQPFVWSRLDFHRTHKGATIAQFGDGSGREGAGPVVAAVHLTHGLTTGSVAAKRLELQKLIGYLNSNFGRQSDPVVIAGDLNIHTSSFAIDAAVERRTITPEAAQSAKTGLDALLASGGYVDAWSARQAAGDVDDDEDEYDEYGGGFHQQTYPGEEGATYDTLTNALAAQITGTGLNNRPQRFDRILVRCPRQLEADIDGYGGDGAHAISKKSGLGHSNFRIESFGKFGYAAGDADDTEPDSFASDHWGIRCVLERAEDAEEDDYEVDQSEGDYSDDDDDEALAYAATGMGVSEEDETGAAAVSASTTYSDEIAQLVVPVEPVQASTAVKGSVETALAGLGAIPSDDETATRKQALELLKSILILDADTVMTGAPIKEPRRQLVLVPAGSYGLGVWTPASDIDCLCIGAYSPSTFFSLARQRLRSAEAAGTPVRIIRRVQAHTGTMFELEAMGIRMDLQYCQASLLAETWPAVLVLPPSHPALQLSAQTLSKLKAVRDVYYLRKSFPAVENGSDGGGGIGKICNSSNFGMAHRAIKTWARSRGLYAARFGYLGGMQIAVLLTRVMKLMEEQIGKHAGGESNYDVADILVTFFHHYAGFDWKTKMAFDPFFHSERKPYLPTSREPMVILGFHRPQLNTAAAASLPSVNVLAAEFQRADVLLGGGITWDEFLRGGSPGSLTAGPGVSLPAGAAEFVQMYRTYIKIDLQYWGLSLRRGAAFVGWLESRCVLLLVDLARRLPALNARIWPGRFVEAGENEEEGLANRAAAEGPEEEEDRQYQGFYLVGLDLPTTMPHDERQLTLGTLLAVMDSFTKQIQRGGESHYDPQWQWLGVGIVNRKELLPGANDRVLRLDNRPWGQYAAGDDADEDDEEEGSDEPGELEDQDAAVTSDEDAAKTASKAKKAKGKGKGGKGRGKNSKDADSDAPTPAPATAGKKFRTAQDVIKRMRWDPHLDRSDYLIGYEDRFLGAQERPLEAWKSEQTDEEFIPQHRVLYFKRKSDGVVVWDRKLRKDDVFGSG